MKIFCCDSLVKLPESSLVLRESELNFLTVMGCWKNLGSLRFQLRVTEKKTQELLLSYLHDCGLLRHPDPVDCPQRFQNTLCQFVGDIRIALSEQMANLGGFQRLRFIFDCGAFERWIDESAEKAYGRLRKKRSYDNKKRARFVSLDLNGNPISARRE